LLSILNSIREMNIAYGAFINKVNSEKKQLSLSCNVTVKLIKFLLLECLGLLDFDDLLNHGCVGMIIIK
jgi:hypothetical protein